MNLYIVGAFDKHDCIVKTCFNGNWTDVLQSFADTYTNGNRTMLLERFDEITNKVLIFNVESTSSYNKLLGYVIIYENITIYDKPVNLFGE